MNATKNHIWSYLAINLMRHTFINDQKCVDLESLCSGQVWFWESAVISLYTFAFYQNWRKIIIGPVSCSETQAVISVCLSLWSESGALDEFGYLSQTEKAGRLKEEETWMFVTLASHLKQSSSCRNVALTCQPCWAPPGHPAGIMHQRTVMCRSSMAAKTLT